MPEIAITEKDLLSSFGEFEKKHNIKETRNDIPKKFLGYCPSKYYKERDMNTTKVSKIVNKLLGKLYGKAL